MQRTEERVALVTGANKGIGLAIARNLAKLNIAVLLGARDGQRGAAAQESLLKEGLKVEYLPLDVTDADSVEKASRSIEKTYGRLDILVNNAAIALERPGLLPSHTSADLVRTTLETNVLGVIAVTNALLPLLRKSPAGRIVNLSSPLGSLSMWTRPDSPLRFAPVLLGYNSSKAALNAVTVMYAKELADTTIKVNSVSPGYIATDLNGHQGTGTAEEGSTMPVQFAVLPEEGPSGGFFDDEGSAITW